MQRSSRIRKLVHFLCQHGFSPIDMKTVFFILLAILVCNVEGNKIRAVRTRVIQYLPYNQHIHPQSQYFSGLPQNQGAPIYKNGRLIYSYINPGGVRFNMLGERGSYAAYLKNYLNRGQVHQNVHRNWPSSAIQGISAPAGQNGLNSGYNGLIGQSAYQSWQNSASGSPIDIPAVQSGINPGHRGHIHTVYQSWQNSADGEAAYASSQKNGANSGHRGNITLYQNWQNSATVRSDYASVEPSEISPGNIDQSLHQSWQDSDGIRPIDIPTKQSDVYPGHTKSTYQSLQSFAPENPGHLSTDQPVFHTGYNGPDQPEYQIWQNSGDGGEINLSVGQNVPNYASGAEIQIVQQNVPNIGQNSENGGQPIFSLDQGGLNEDSKPQFNDIINEISINTEGNTEPDHYVTEHDLIFSMDGSKLNQPNEAPLQNIVKAMIINNEENISPIGAVTENYLISPDNEDISGSQSNLNGAVQEPFKEIQFNNEEGNNALSTVTENDIGYPNTEGMITNHSVTEQDLIFSVDGSKLNQANEAPLQDIVKDMIINHEENISPIEVVTENYLISPVNEDIISGDQSNLNWTFQGPFQEIQFKNKEGISPVSAVTENYIDFPNNEGMITVYAADQTPLKDIEKGFHVNNEKNDIPSNFITEGDQISPDNIDNMGLLTDMANNEEISVPISTEPVNDLISLDNDASFLGQSELNEATGAPLRQLVERIRINNAENRGPVTLIENNPTTLSKNMYLNDQTNQRQRPLPIYPYIFKPVQQQNAVPRYLHILKSNQQESPVAGYPYIIKQNQHQSPGYTTTWNQYSTPSQGLPLNVPFKMPPGNLQWIKSVSRNVSPQQANNVFSSVCLNPNTNVIPERERTQGVWYGDRPEANTQEIIEYIKTLDMSDSPQIIYKNRETAKIGSTNLDHTNPNFYQEMYPSNKPNSININKHNIPQPNYYVPTPSQAVQNGFHIQPEILNPHKHPIPRFGIGVNEDEKVITKDPESSIIYIEPHGIEQTFATRNLLPESRQPITSKITKLTGYEEPRQLMRTTPKHYVYRLTKAFMPELMRLYHSKCDNEYDEKLLNEFKKLVDTIQREHCEIL